MSENEIPIKERIMKFERNDFILVLDNFERFYRDEIIFIKRPPGGDGFVFGFSRKINLFDYPEISENTNLSIADLSDIGRLIITIASASHTFDNPFDKLLDILKIEEEEIEKYSEKIKLFYDIVINHHIISMIYFKLTNIDDDFTISSSLLKTVHFPKLNRNYSYVELILCEGYEYNNNGTNLKVNLDLMTLENFIKTLTNIRDELYEFITPSPEDFT